jgi:acetylglutamate kinase
MGSPATEMAVPHVASRGMATTGTDGADVLHDVARALHDQTVVIKYGGSAVDHGGREEEFGRDVARLQASGIKPVVVHGGGPQISDLMRRFGKTPRFVDGMRVTDAETMDLVEMVLVGKIGEAIVGLINQEGGRAIGLSGKDADMLLAHRHRHRLPTGEEVDLGMVGDIDRVDTEPVRLLAAHGFAPVIAPIAVGQSGETYNVNADLAAGAIAAALGAAVLVHLTDVPGVRDGDAGPPRRRRTRPDRGCAHATRRPARARAGASRRDGNHPVTSRPASRSPARGNWPRGSRRSSCCRAAARSRCRPPSCR